MPRYTVTVPMPDGDSLKAIGDTAQQFDLVIEAGWATFGGQANTPEEFEQELIDGILGLPERITAVESW
tara:strand:+ start:422 stop:628 length:207 start_codon:yes stop_codon:yes gene_type:complete